MENNKMNIAVPTMREISEVETLIRINGKIIEDSANGYYQDAIKDESDPDQILKAQKDYCKYNSLPNFAPSDGICFSCNFNIYQDQPQSKGINIMKAKSEHITGCPHCLRTFLD